MRKAKGFMVLLAGVLTASVLAPTVVKADGWVLKPEGYYYVYDNGAIATNTTVGIIAIGPTGLVTVNDAIAQTNRVIALTQQAAETQAASAQQAAAAQAAAAQAAAAQQVAQSQVASASTTALYDRCAQIVNSTTTAQMSEIDKTRALFNYMVAATEYKRDYTTPTGNWGPAYAYEALTTGTGNCYKYAAAYAYLLKAAGLDSRIAYGQIHAARGGLTPHSWTEVNIGGVWYTVDCEMHDAKKGKYDFFMKTLEQYPIKPLNTEGYLPVSF